MDLSHLELGDQMNVEVHDGGAITMPPFRPMPSADEVTFTVCEVMKDYGRTMKRLS